MTEFMEPLSDLTVIELPGNPGVGFCGKMFAWLGARVTKVSFEQETNAEVSLARRALAAYLDARKEQRRVDPGSTAVLRRLQREISQADVVITSAIPAPLGSSLTIEGCKENPRLILVLVTDFGFGGPY